MISRFIIAAILLMPLVASGHNLLWGDFDDLTNSTIHIKQASPHNEMYGSGSGQDFTISGDDITVDIDQVQTGSCLLYTSPSPRDATLSRMPSSA